MKLNIVFFTIMLPIALCVSCQKEKTPMEERALNVEIMKPEKHIFEKIIRAHGNVEAAEYAELCARVAGIVDIRPASEGTLFKKGDILFQIDKLSLEREVLSASQDLKVSESTVLKSHIDVEFMKIQMEKADIDYKRATTLKNAKVISDNEYELSGLMLKKAFAELKQAEANLDYSIALKEKAESNLDIATKKLADSIIKADFDGVVTEEFKEIGEYANKAEPVLRIENPESIEAVALIGADYYGLIKKDETMARIISGDKSICVPVTYCAPNIDPTKRTFKIKINLAPDSNFVSGMLCEIQIIKEKKEGLGIPSLAILERQNERKIAFAFGKSSTAEELELLTGIEEGGWTEIIKPDISDKAIIIKGQSFLNNGDKIKINHNVDDKQDRL